MGTGGEDVIGLVYVDLFSFWYTVPAELGVVPRLIIQLRVVQVFGCFHARYSLRWTLKFCISLFLLRRSLTVDRGIRNSLLSCVQGMVWLDCLLVSRWWGLACDREGSTEHLPFPFCTRLVQREPWLPSGIFPHLKEEVVLIGILSQWHAVLFRLQKDWYYFEGERETEEFLVYRFTFSNPLCFDESVLNFKLPGACLLGQYFRWLHSGFTDAIYTCLSWKVIMQPLSTHLSLHNFHSIFKSLRRASSVFLQIQHS